MALVSSLALAAIAVEEPDKRSIALVAYEGASRPAIQAALVGLRKRFNVPVVVVPGAKLPKAAYYAPRNRYRADELLKHISLRTEWKAIGVTHRDISTTNGPHKDWGIFGLAELGGDAAVVSPYRLRGSSVSLQKVAIHEVGHTMGLPHCETESCVMADAEGSINTVLTGSDKFCKSCSTRIRSYLK